MKGNRNTKRACQVCGKPFFGGTSRHYCAECAKAKKREALIRPRTCIDCGKIFDGGPKAKRCPRCAYIAKREREKHRKKGEAMRPLGSTDKCPICGKEYIVTSPRQKYCSEICTSRGNKARNREHARAYYKAKALEQGAKKRKLRQTQEKICVYCLRKFKTSTQANTCSDYCRREQRHINNCLCDLRKGRYRDYGRYLERRRQYRESVKGKADLPEDNNK